MGEDSFQRYLNMKEQRIVIADRSTLAHNLYKMLLRPLGLKFLTYQTLKDLKENLNSKWNCHLFLINSNIFGNHFDYHWEWLQKNSHLKNTHKIFLCGPGEKKIQTQLKTLSHSHLVTKPFFPDDLETILNRVLRKKR